MSKAFTRESDDLPEPATPLKTVSSLPPGAKNYVTSTGAQRWRDELESLQSKRAEVLGETAENQTDRTAIDQRIQRLRSFLQTADVVSAPAPPHDQVRFGATVTVRDQFGATESYRIVGVDEADFDRGWISWLSPIAKALLNARIAQRIRFRLPAGDRELEIVAIAYE